MIRPSIIVNGLTIKFEGRPVLDGLSFQLAPGQHLALKGSTGSGKSTLAKAIAGQIYYQGEIRIDGVSENYQTPILYVEQQNKFKNLSNQNSFYYQQRYNSNESEDSETVLSALYSYNRNIINNKQLNERSIEDWLNEFGLETHMHKPLIQLSNGEHKKLQLIKALMLQPAILILDQPFTGLDAGSRRFLKDVLNRLSAHTTLIIISGKNDLPGCITHVLDLNNGRLDNISLYNKIEGTSTSQTTFDSYKHFPFKSSLTDFTIAIEMRNVTVKYDDKIILQGINWKVSKGEKWLVSGPNGSGKSTLLSLVSGDNPQAYANDIYLFDRKRGTGETIWDIKKKIGFISPELHWYFDKGISVYEAIASGFFDTMGLYKKLAYDQELTINEWITHLNLQSFRNKPLHILSAGYQRLVLLARALVKNPPLLILDEPCQGLDEEQIENFNNLLDGLCSTTDKTLVYINHYENEIPLCIDQKLVLNNGRAEFTTIHTKKEKAA